MSETRSYEDWQAGEWARLDRITEEANPGPDPEGDE